MSKTNTKTQILEYKGFPLRRKDNIVYYGRMTDKYIIMLEILETKKHDDLEMATKVHVQLQYTDPELKSRNKVIKKADKNGFYDAIDVAAVWLERAIAAG